MADRVTADGPPHPRTGGARPRDGRGGADAGGREDRAGSVRLPDGEELGQGGTVGADTGRAPEPGERLFPAEAADVDLGQAPAGAADPTAPDRYPTALAIAPKAPRSAPPVPWP